MLDGEVDTLASLAMTTIERIPGDLSEPMTGLKFSSEMSHDEYLLEWV